MRSEGRGRTARERLGASRVGDVSKSRGRLYERPTQKFLQIRTSCRSGHGAEPDLEGLERALLAQEGVQRNRAGHAYARDLRGSCPNRAAVPNTFSASDHQRTGDRPNLRVTTSFSMPDMGHSPKFEQTPPSDTRMRAKASCASTPRQARAVLPVRSSRPFATTAR